jgi:hypothetical protein
MFASWREFYQSDLQTVYAPCPVPAFFMLYWLLFRPTAAEAWSRARRRS